MPEWIQHAIRMVPSRQPGDLLVLAAVLVGIRLLLELSAKSIEKMEPAGAARLRLSWLAAALPGIAFLALAPGMIHTMNPQAMGSRACMAHCYGLIGVLMGAIGTAAWRTWRSLRGATQLSRIAHRPSPRLAKFAEELGIIAAELPTDSPICAVTGILRPRVLLSRGALARFSDEELRAALAHERAHLRRRETLCEGVAAFLNRCTVLPVPATLNVYRRSREFAADREAARDVQPITLANVLLAFAKFEIRQPAVQLAERASLRDRVALLLNDSAPSAGEKIARAAAVASIAVTVVVASLPAGIHALQRAFCAMGR